MPSLSPDFAPSGASRMAPTTDSRLSSRSLWSDFVVFSSCPRPNKKPKPIARPHKTAPISCGFHGKKGEVQRASAVEASWFRRRKGTLLTGLRLCLLLSLFLGPPTAVDPSSALPVYLHCFARQISPAGLQPQTLSLLSSFSSFLPSTGVASPSERQSQSSIPPLFFVDASEDVSLFSPPNASVSPVSYSHWSPSFRPLAPAVSQHKSFFSPLFSFLSGTRNSARAATERQENRELPLLFNASSSRLSVSSVYRRSPAFACAAVFPDENGSRLLSVSLRPPRTLCAAGFMPSRERQDARPLDSSDCRRLSSVFFSRAPLPVVVSSSPSRMQQLLSFASPPSSPPACYSAVSLASPASSSFFAPSPRHPSLSALAAEPPGSVPQAASPRAQAVLEEIKKLTLVEAAELVSLIETTFGVSARLPVAGPGASSAAAEAEEKDNADAPAPEKTQFDVVIKAVPLEKRIAVIKTLRTVRTDLGLKEAKAVIDALPNTILKQVDKGKAEEVRKTLADAGAEIAIE
ncbi:putative 50S ribosomal protein L12 [Toxoplasma gondii GAB2-2007-GAL-DOM2]|nr:putative 50S ribosomal protein L12 [Toxoplasma gondii GT1]KAF4644412.1 putative 50S ribosomal protein L12 [Toxoplasma gondii]KFG42672.1 putative 50S ribosomal protein L12 [Toxoplasma gondii GAB2-2007-GAL-DOM2]KFG53284.1 putative 50S ribosomal protein L12 [Toxoplasma gondii FOU]KFH08894.1 putative 50S ribosomal protein L12 [Toxoplasma gondii VAND]RQX73786.1 putative 50S ribosomal protein L12 [Toxoplasma gondii CAST]